MKNLFARLKETISEVVDTVTTPQPKIDTSNLTWEERVLHYSALETVNGYTEALRLIDLYMPEHPRLLQIWAEALKKHPEFAFEIYDRIYITNNVDIWHQIHELHLKSLDFTVPEYKKYINEVIASIEYYKLDAQHTAKPKLAMIYDYEPSKYCYDPSIMELAEKGCWEQLESELTATIQAQITNREIAFTQLGHALANFADSIKEPERSIAFLRKYIPEVGEDTSLKWRLAILYRNLNRCNDDIQVLKELGKCTTKLEYK